MAAQRRTFTKTIDGEQVVAHASTAADAVRLRFNGWREQREPAAAPAESSAAATPADDTAAGTTSTASYRRPAAATPGKAKTQPAADTQAPAS